MMGEGDKTVCYVSVNGVSGLCESGISFKIMPLCDLLHCDHWKFKDRCVKGCLALKCHRNLSQTNHEVILTKERGSYTKPYYVRNFVGRYLVLKCILCQITFVVYQIKCSWYHLVACQMWIRGGRWCVRIKQVRISVSLKYLASVIVMSTYKQRKDIVNISFCQFPSGWAPISSRMVCQCFWQWFMQGVGVTVIPSFVISVVILSLWTTCVRPGQASHWCAYTETNKLLALVV